VRLVPVLVVCGTIEAAARRRGPARNLQHPTQDDGRGARGAPSYAFHKHLHEEVQVSDMLKVIEVLAESDKSWEDAAAEAVKRSSKTLKNIRSIYVENLEAKVEGGKIVRYRINAKVSFVLE
jgi:flavin-binding protein dodecin